MNEVKFSDSSFEAHLFHFDNQCIYWLSNMNQTIPALSIHQPGVPPRHNFNFSSLQKTFGNTIKVIISISVMTYAGVAVYCSFSSGSIYFWSDSGPWGVNCSKILSSLSDAKFLLLFCEFPDREIPLSRHCF